MNVNDLYSNVVIMHAARAYIVLLIVIKSNFHIFTYFCGFLLYSRIFQNKNTYLRMCMITHYFYKLFYPGDETRFTRMM